MRKEDPTSSLLRRLALVVLFALATACSTSTPPAKPRNLTGVIDAAPYEIDVPASWNGTLFLYSHGYVAPGAPNSAQSAPGDVARNWLLDHHFAAAGSAYRSTGWAVEDALKDQIALLDFFTKRVGKPKRVIAWGHSMGGLITAGLAQQYPDRFAAAMPLCGVLSGGVATWNSGLDGGYAFKTLLAPRSQLEVVHITDAQGDVQLARQILTSVKDTPQGEARLGLVAAIVDLPGWFDPRQPEPAVTDFVGRLAAQESWEVQAIFGFAFGGRLELEQRAGGNPSWNEGVDYRRLLDASPDRDEVNALYPQAGLNLQADLQTLNMGATIKADSGAVAYLDRNISFDGSLRVPMLSAHTTGDGLVIPPNESAYAQLVDAAGHQDSLRQVFVHRAGHCTFTAAETIAALQVLLKRLDSGKWNDAALQPSALNASALAQGGAANSFFGVAFSPSFVTYQPGPHPRPFAKGGSVPT